MTASTPITGPRPRIPFAEAYASQATELPAAAARIEEQLSTDIVGGLRDRPLVFTGIGASHSVLATPVWVLRMAGVPDVLRSDTTDIPLALPEGREPALIGVSQSGRSREVIEYFRDARGYASRLAIVNHRTGPLSGIADDALSVGEYFDSGMSSVGFNGLLIALDVLTRRIIDAPTFTRWSELVTETMESVERERHRLGAFASLIAENRRVDLVAQASQRTSVEQAALMMREGPLIASLADVTRQYLHGPMDAAVGGGTTHVIIGGERESQLALQLAEAASAPVLLLSYQETPTVNHPLISVIPLKSWGGPAADAVAETLFLQALTGEVSACNGIPIERPTFVRQDTKLDSPSDA